jgi:UDP-N-acetyl-D-glucosamine dehydrogenase
MPSDIAIIGAGYVGLPLAVAFAQAGQRVHCIDTDTDKVDAIAAGRSYISDVGDDVLVPLSDSGMLTAGGDFAAVAEAGAILICVPTPLSDNREPNVSIVAEAASAIAPHLRRGQLVVLESTTYPGTTRELVAPLLERGGLRAGQDFNLAMSPERIDPGRTDHTVRTTPKVVGGLTPACTERAIALPAGSSARIPTKSSTETGKLMLDWMNPLPNRSIP